MAAFYKLYRRNTLCAAIWYMVISAVEDGKNDEEIHLTWTLWSVSSFTAKKAVIAIDTLLEDVYYCWYCYHYQMDIVRSCKSKTELWRAKMPNCTCLAPE
jgi:hypothetical protein